MKLEHSKKVDDPFKFYLGCPNSSWLSRHKGIPFFVSRNRMPKVKFKPSVTSWALDSGGFTELQRYGKWTISATEYAERVNIYAEKVGNLDWAAPQDWMCEPVVINGGSAAGLSFKGTRLSVTEHQKRTVDNYLELQDKCVVPVIPVVQGFTLEDYLFCTDLYLLNGVDLRSHATVGVGSICRRQATSEVQEILKTLHGEGLSIHAFGAKRAALKGSLRYMSSADSMAWSFNARHAGKTCGRLNRRTGEPIKNCANCHHAAVAWYKTTMDLIGV